MQDIWQAINLFQVSNGSGKSHNEQLLHLKSITVGYLLATVYRIAKVHVLKRFRDKVHFNTERMFTSLVET